MDRIRYHLFVLATVLVSTALGVYLVERSLLGFLTCTAMLVGVWVYFMPRPRASFWYTFYTVTFGIYGLTLGLRGWTGAWGWVVFVLALLGFMVINGWRTADFVDKSLRTRKGEV